MGTSCDFALEPDEARAWREDGFFAREAAFSRGELDELRDAAERVASLVARASHRGDGYAIDGNRYVEAADATVQFEHAADSETIRVIEPFHHFDPVLAF